MSHPTPDDVSKPKVDEYSYKKEFYRDAAVAAHYDRRRFATPKRQRRNVRKWRAIARALAETGGIERVLDLPCGTGRFTSHLARAGFTVVGSDISLQMMHEAQRAPVEAGTGRIAGYVDADAEALPFASSAVDCVVSIRFMFHVDPVTRRRILREMGRVSRRWLIVDYRHRYTVRWLLYRLRAALGLLAEAPERVSREGLRSEFRDAGLVIRRIVPVRRFVSDKWVVLAEAPHDEPAFDRDLATARLRGTELDGAEIVGTFGEGRRSTVYRALWRGREIALKVYKRSAIATHERKLGGSIARFEHLRNRRFHEVAGLERYVARPLACVVTPGIQATAQEPVEGELYYFLHRREAGRVPASFTAHLERLLELSFAAGLYDIDLHAMNVLVAREPSGELVPRLFDFNLIPFTERAQNPIVGWLLRRGWIARESRDRRRLKKFHDFRHIERRLLKFHSARG